MARFEVKTSSILTLAECAAELIPGWLRNYHEDNGQNGTLGDTLERIDHCGGRKRAGSLVCDAGRPSKLAKYEDGPMMLQVPRLISHPSPHPTHVVTTPGPVSVPVPRLISPLPKRAPSVSSGSSAIEDPVDISWIPETYRLFVRNDTMMHSRFMSECTYPVLTYNKSGGVRKRNCKQRKEFLENDEWVMAFGVYHVVCKACDGDVALDKRSGFYYPGFWVKHRSVCPTVYAIWLQRKGMSPDADKEWFMRHKPMAEQD